jgi:protein-S-isoprenylcysteine O-methyltransferase Ste14
MRPRVQSKQLAGYLAIFIVMPILTFLIGRFTDNYLGLPSFPSFPLNMFLGVYTMILCINIGVKSTKALYEKGSGLPWGEAKEEVKSSCLVTSGPFTYSRNPMMLGYSFLPFAMGLIFRSLGMALSVTPIVLVVNMIILITKEEPGLVERFGEEYLEYKSRTPLLFPRISMIWDYIVKYYQKNRELITYVVLAQLSLILVSLLSIRGVQNDQSLSFLRAAFFSICLIGIVAGLFPGFLSFSKAERRDSKDVSGHHPSCGFFPGHVVKVMGSAVCAGCTGLVIGAVLSMLFLVVGIRPFWFGREVAFWSGVLFVSLGLVQHFIDLGSGWVHLWLNVWFVIGAWMIFESIQRLNLSIQLYFLASTLFWIWARIRASQWNHVYVCNVCLSKCKHRFE